MASQTIPCPRCGKSRRVRRDRLDAICRDCVRATYTPGADDALEGGYWITERGVSRYRFYETETA
jgi:hypothetical protein